MHRLSDHGRLEYLNEERRKIRKLGIIYTAVGGNAPKNVKEEELINGISILEEYHNQVKDMNWKPNKNLRRNYKAVGISKKSFIFG